MGRSFEIHFQIHSIDNKVETRAYREINIVICIKKLKKFEGGLGQDDVILCSEGGLSNNNGGEGGG